MRPPLVLDDVPPELDRWLLDAEFAVTRTKALLDRMAGEPPRAPEVENDEDEDAEEGEGQGEEDERERERWPPG